MFREPIALPTVTGDCVHLPGVRKYKIQVKKITVPDDGANPQVTADSKNLCLAIGPLTLPYYCHAGAPVAHLVNPQGDG